MVKLAPLLDRILRRPSVDRAEGRRRLLHGFDRRYAVIYAMGDVHGCLEALMEAERRIMQDARAQAGPKLVVMLGDYVDRGPCSRPVLDHLTETQLEGMDRIALCGNHDEVFLQFLTARKPDLRWLDFGGYETLASYGVDADAVLKNGEEPEALQRLACRAVGPAHMAWLRSLPLLLAADGFVFVHAGVAPRIALIDQQDADLMWIREPFLSRGPEMPCVVVHGHTRSVDVEFGPQRIGIDTGCYATGRLAVLRIAGGRVAEI